MFLFAYFISVRIKRGALKNFLENLGISVDKWK